MQRPLPYPKYPHNASHAYIDENYLLYLSFHFFRERERVRNVSENGLPSIPSLVHHEVGAHCVDPLDGDSSVTFIDGLQPGPHGANHQMSKQQSGVYCEVHVHLGTGKSERQY